MIGWKWECFTFENVRIKNSLNVDFKNLILNIYLLVLVDVVSSNPTLDKNFILLFLIECIPRSSHENMQILYSKSSMSFIRGKKGQREIF